MGQRGPKALPANVRMLRGNLGKRPLNDAGAIEPDVEIPNCPKHLLPEARKFWKRMGPKLEELGLIAAIDQPSFALVCQEWAWLVWHETLLQRSIKFVEAKRAEWEADSANAGKQWLGGDGFQVPTPNGSFTYSPHWVARNRHAQQLDRFLASFGMSPSSRGKVTASSRQLSLPGVPDPKEGFSAF